MRNPDGAVHGRLVLEGDVSLIPRLCKRAEARLHRDRPLAAERWNPCSVRFEYAVLGVNQERVRGYPPDGRKRVLAAAGREVGDVDQEAEKVVVDLALVVEQVLAGGADAAVVFQREPDAPCPGVCDALAQRGHDLCAMCFKRSLARLAREHPDRVRLETRGVVDRVLDLLYLLLQLALAPYGEVVAGNVRGHIQPRIAHPRAHLGDLALFVLPVVAQIHGVHAQVSGERDEPAEVHLLRLKSLLKAVDAQTQFHVAPLHPGQSRPIRRRLTGHKEGGRKSDHLQ